MAKKSTATDGQLRYVAYYRVSTAKQGRSGLGLEAQEEAVAQFVKGPIIDAFTEVESGKRNQREQLRLAIEAAKKHNAILVIAKLDRLSRNAGFIFALRDSGVNFQCVDLPDANTLTVGIFATLAQHERELISGRTKAALEAKRARGESLGKPENMSHAAQLKGAEANRRNALDNSNNRLASAMIESLQKTGMNYTAIAAHLNRVGFRTARGKEFQATQVMRLHRRQVEGESVNNEKKQ